MLIDRFSDVLALMQLQRAVAQIGTGNIILSILVGGLVVLAVDYAWMIYLHYKMVSINGINVSFAGGLTLAAPRTVSSSHHRQHTPSPRDQAVDIF
jgi:hypothetical protein